MSAAGTNRTLERILGGAEDFLSRSGLRLLTMDRLSGHLGMSKKTIYTCFDSKFDLVGAILDRKVQTIRTGMRKIRADQDLSVVAKIQATFAFARKQIHGVGYTVLEELASVYPDIWRQINDARYEILTEHFGILLREAHTAGLCREDVDPDLATLIITRTISTVVQPAELVGLPYSADDLIDGLARLLFAGILTGPAQAEFLEQGR